MRGITGSLAGTAGYLGASAGGRALTLSANGDSVNVGTGDVVGAGSPWSAVAWVYRQAATSGFTSTVIAKRNSFTVGGHQFSLAYSNDAAASPGSVTVGKDASYNNLTAAGTVPLNAWSFIGVACGANGAVAYANGRDVTGSIGGNLATSGDWTSGSGTTQTVSLGRLLTENSEQLIGQMFDGAVWNRKLSPAEMWSLYDPRTRWDLYYVPGRRVFFDVGAAAAAARANRLTLMGVA